MPLDQALERKRRRHTLLATVPRLLNRHLAPVLGSGRWLFIARLLTSAGRYKRLFAKPTDDAALTKVKATFLLVGALYNELVPRVGAERALSTTQAFLFDLASEVQRTAYFGPNPSERGWDRLHDEHELQMNEGFISANEHDAIQRSADRVSLHITRCRFHECFRDMGNAAITEAFCRSDEAVFNDYSATIRFHRGGMTPDTIARGAKTCTFVFDRKG